MKKIMMLASVASVGLLLTASAAFAATSVTAEQQYIESYKGRTDVPVPLVVVSPKVNSSYAGRVVELSFTVEPDGKPRGLKATSSVDAELEHNVMVAVEKWEFAPVLRNGEAVPMKVVLPVRITEAK